MSLFVTVVLSPIQLSSLCLRQDLAYTRSAVTFHIDQLSKKINKNQGETGQIMSYTSKSDHYQPHTSKLEGHSEDMLCSACTNM